MAVPARTIDPAEAVDLATRSHEPVIVERDGTALAAVIPIDLFEKWSAESDGAEISLVDELLTISSSVPDEEWAKLTDCDSMLAMEDRGIQDALSSDQHFNQVGFRALLAED